MKLVFDIVLMTKSHIQCLPFSIFQEHDDICDTQCAEGDCNLELITGYYDA